MRDLYLGMAIILCHLPLAAQETPEAENKTDKATERKNPASTVPVETGKGSTSTCEDCWSNFPPIWGKEECAMGYVRADIGFTTMDVTIDQSTQEPLN